MVGRGKTSKRKIYFLKIKTSGLSAKIIWEYICSFLQMEDTSSSTDVNSSSSHRQQFTAQDLQHVLYDRNPVKIVHVYGNINESRVDCSGEK